MRLPHSVDIAITGRRKPPRTAQFSDEEASARVEQYLANPGAVGHVSNVVERDGKAPVTVFRNARGRPVAVR
jgi:hypothetical protein